MGLPVKGKALGKLWESVSGEQGSDVKVEDRTVDLQRFKSKILRPKDTSGATKPKSACLIHGPTSAVASVARPFTAAGRRTDQMDTKKGKRPETVPSNSKSKDARDALVVMNSRVSAHVSHL